MNNTNNTVNNINENIVLDPFGDIDIDFYISKGRALRNKAIVNQFTVLTEKVKAFVKPSDIVVGNIKAA